MKGFKIKIIILSVIILFGIIINQLYKSIDKSTKEFAETYCENYICELVNDCILESVEKLSAEYNSICKIHYDSSGKINAILIDSESVNKLKGETVSSIIHKLKDEEKESFRIPLGTLSGSRLFSARGPEIEIKYIPLGSVASELIQKFASVGINQTLHSLYLNVRISLRVSSPFSSTNIQISTDVCIAETVIIGDIPFSYID
jgi:sporulation protein YunB